MDQKFSGPLLLLQAAVAAEALDVNTPVYMQTREQVSTSTLKMQLYVYIYVYIYIYALIHKDMLPLIKPI